MATTEQLATNIATKKDESTCLNQAADGLRKTMGLGRIPLIVIGSGMSAGVFAPTMREIHTYLAAEIGSEAPKATREEIPLIETIQALLHEITQPAPPEWSGATPPDLPRSIQVRLYNLLQTSQSKSVRQVWQRFGEALLLRKMVKPDQGTLFDPSKTLAELDPSCAHAWAAILALQGRAVVASLNYDGLTRKAVERLAKKFMTASPTSPAEKNRRTCRILSTADEIRGFFTGTEVGLDGTTVPCLADGKIPWRPVPVIKFRGDVFHAVCHNRRCPEAEKPTPLYFVLPSDLEDGDLPQRHEQLRRKLCCECCRYPRQLEISFPGVFDKERQIDHSLAAFHQYFGARLAGIVFLGFSGTWDESLVDYLARRAATLEVPVISLSLDETPALQEAAVEHGAHYSYVEYRSTPLPGHGDFDDARLNTLIPVSERVGVNAERDSEQNAIPTSKDSAAHTITLAFLPEMLSPLEAKPLEIGPARAGHESPLTIKVEKRDHDDKSVELYSAAVATEVFQALKSCSQLGVKGLLLRETESQKHTRFHHSASATAIARMWYEVLRADSKVRLDWAGREEGRIALELAVLFHDARHLPFSHMMEEVFRELNWGHRPASVAPTVPRYTTDDAPKLSQLSPALPNALENAGVSVADLVEWWRKVRAIQDGRTGNPWLEAIVDSALDADKVEYIFNDTKLTGQSVRLAEFSGWFAAFLSGQSVTPEGLIRLEGESSNAAIELLQERAHLYRTLFLAPELRGLECLARYIVLSWLKWKVPDSLNFEELKKQKFSVEDDLRSQKSKAAGDLLWDLFTPKKGKGKSKDAPRNELAGLALMVSELTEGDIARHLDQAAIEWIKQLWSHLEPFQVNPPGGRPHIRDARSAFEKLSPHGPLYIHNQHEQKLRGIARRWRVHSPLLGLIDLAPFPGFLATPSDRWEQIGGARFVAEHFLVPGEHPSGWRRRSRATTPLHRCDFKSFEYPVIQVLILDPFGEASGGGAFLYEMLRRELQRENIPHGESPEFVLRTDR